MPSYKLFKVEEFVRHLHTTTFSLEDYYFWCNCIEMCRLVVSNLYLFPFTKLYKHTRCYALARTEKWPREITSVYSGSIFRNMRCVMERFSVRWHSKIYTHFLYTKCLRGFHPKTQINVYELYGYFSFRFRYSYYKIF